MQKWWVLFQRLVTAILWHANTSKTALKSPHPAKMHSSLSNFKKLTEVKARFGVLKKVYQIRLNLITTKLNKKKLEKQMKLRYFHQSSSLMLLIKTQLCANAHSQVILPSTKLLEHHSSISISTITTSMHIRTLGIIKSSTANLQRRVDQYFHSYNNNSRQHQNLLPLWNSGMFLQHSRRVCLRIYLTKVLNFNLTLSAFKIDKILAELSQP